jgi:hypothetical protein
LRFRRYREELVEEGAQDVDKRVEQGFANWFKGHVSD